MKEVGHEYSSRNVKWDPGLPVGGNSPHKAYWPNMSGKISNETRAKVTVITLKILSGNYMIHFIH